MNDPATRRQMEILAEDSLNTAYQLQMDGELEAAIEAYQDSIALHATAEAHTFLGWTYSFLGRLDEAIEECRKAIDVDPTFGNPYNDIGAYLLQLGHPEDAIPWLQRAREATRYEAPYFPLCNLGRAFEILGRLDEAAQAYREALRIEPGYAPAIRALRRLERPASEGS